MSDPRLTLSTAPFLHERKTTPGIMRDVLLALLPVLVLAMWLFGLAALLVVLAATAGCMLTEWLFTRGQRPSPLLDNTALLTGVLLGMTLPPRFPLWMAFFGGVVAITLGKLVWGGLGQNVFNPALVGRAFLQAAFPGAITSWEPLHAAGGFWTLPPSLFAVPFMKAPVDGITAATPLGLAKFEHQFTGLELLLKGTTTGSLGETGGIVLVLVGLWLVSRRIFDWRLPVATLGSAALFAGILHAVNPLWPDPLFVLFSGGLMFAAVFMVTDPVTTPTTPLGAWIFGAGVGFLVVLIRVFGGLPEGVMYAILLMNAMTPHLNRLTQPRRFGG